MKMNALGMVAFILLIIGGLNWGLVGWLDYNLVDKIFGVGSGLSRAIYALVGVATIYIIFASFSMMGTMNKKKS